MPLIAVLAITFFRFLQTVKIMEKDKSSNPIKLYGDLKTYFGGVKGEKSSVRFSLAT